MTRRFFFGSVMLAIAALMPTWALGSDQEAAQGIADAIRQSGRLKDYSIGVKYENGTATLMGRVANDQQSQTAVEMAEKLPGVTAVVNNLEVKATAKKDFAVEPTAHTNGSARRTTSRDDLAFGGTNVEAPAPVAPPAMQQAAPAGRPVSYNAGIGHHHGHAANAGGYSSGQVMSSSGYTPALRSRSVPRLKGAANASPTINRTCRATLGRAMRPARTTVRSATRRNTRLRHGRTSVRSIRTRKFRSAGGR